MFILFGGGDAGGFWIGADGKIHRIPPWNPDVLAQLKAVSSLVALGTQVQDAAIVKEAGALAERLSTTVIPKVTKIAGASNLGDSSIAFFDADGGFVCGSTGKRPIPVPPHSFTGGISTVRPTLTTADVPVAPSAPAHG